MVVKQNWIYKLALLKRILNYQLRASKDYEKLYQTKKHLTIKKDNNMDSNGEGHQVQLFKASTEIISTVNFKLFSVLRKSQTS